MSELSNREFCEDCGYPAYKVEGTDRWSHDLPYGTSYTNHKLLYPNCWNNARVTASRLRASPCVEDHAAIAEIGGMCIECGARPESPESHDPLDETCVYCAKTKGDHFGPENDPVCYAGNAFGRRFMGTGEFASPESAQEAAKEPAIDWDDDEAVVRSARPTAYKGIGDGNIFTMGNQDGAMPDCAFWLGQDWADARNNPSVQAFERASNPAYAKEAPTFEAWWPTSPWHSASYRDRCIARSTWEAAMAAQSAAPKQ